MTGLPIAASIAAATLLCCGSALAQSSATPFASHGSVAIGVERLFGVDYTRVVDRDASTGRQGQTVSITSISFLGYASQTVVSNLATEEPIATRAFLAPSLGFDVFLGPGFSVGGGATYQHLGMVREQPQYATSDLGTSYYVFSPRVGFGLPLNRRVAIWPRAGAAYSYAVRKLVSTYEDGSTGLTSKVTTSTWFAVFDALLQVSPFEHVALSVGPSFDVLIGGPARKIDGVGVPVSDTSKYSLGLHAGLLIWF